MFLSELIFSNNIVNGLKLLHFTFCCLNLRAAMLGKDERVFQAFALVFDLWSGVCNTLYLESDFWLSEA